MSSFPTRGPSNQTITLPPIPELFNPQFLDILLPPSASGDISVEQEAAPNQRDTFTDPQKFVTTNRTPAAESTGLAALSAFNDLNAQSQKSFNTMDKILEASWAEDPDITLRIIWHMRSIHEGKGEKELFYRAFGWLYENHPRTAISNLHMIVSPVCAVAKNDPAPHGYWKDLLNILALATLDELLDFYCRKNNFLRTYTPKRGVSEEQTRQHRKQKQERYYEQLTGKLVISKYRALYIAIARLFAEQIRKDVKVLDEFHALETETKREQPRTLARMVSLVGKWAPTPGGSHDRVTNLSTAICQLLFSPNENVGLGVIGPLPSSTPHPISTDQNNCIILRNYFHRWILKPLREVIGCPESLMSANKWEEIQYSQVPSVCMSRNKARFIFHDPEGFRLHLARIRSKRWKIGAKSSMPHELLGQALELHRVKDAALHEAYPRVAEFQLTFVEQQLEVIHAQWHSLISCLKQRGSLESTLALCDVSNSMGSIYDYDKNDVNPRFPSTALSLVLASMANPPFASGFITFSPNPEFVHLGGLASQISLTNMVNEIMQAQSGSTVDLQAVFLDLLLPLARDNNVTKEDMVKRIIVFSDKQFDHAAAIITGPWWLNRTSESERADRWETTYSLIERAFKEAGYDVPEIVYWDLVGERTVRQTVELEAERRGVRMMSGFSNAMIKNFLGEGEEAQVEVFAETEPVEQTYGRVISPMKAVFAKSFDGLVIVD